jgi:glycine hydroxymethyltransferase
MSAISGAAGSRNSGFFSLGLAEADPEVDGAVRNELRRQQGKIELIASENIVSRAVLEAQGSVLTNKYAEGYPGRRYYGGCEFVDVAEELAIARAKRLFDCTFANVQPHSGAQANQAVFLALLKPGDCFMGLALDAGGHLTHGSPVNESGKWFRPVMYGVRRQDQRIDMDEVAALASEHRPKLIIAGGSAYSRVIDFASFRRIADSVGAIFMVDMVTTTTHKTLRGPRGGLILSRDPELGRKINSAVFPGLQGGPLMHVIAAKAVALGEALKPDFKLYARAVVENAEVLADSLQAHGLDIVSGGTDTHLMLVDLRPKKATGRAAEKALDRAHITCNKNAIPFDSEKAAVTSGIRLGTPAGTTRGFGPQEFKEIGAMIVEIVDALAHGADGDEAVETRVRARATELCHAFPIYGFGLPIERLAH